MNQDIIIDANNEPLIVNGDFVVGVSDGQHLQMLLQLQKGELKQYPDVGVGMTKYINGNVDGRLRKEIKEQLEMDGYDSRGLKINGDQIEINVSES
ncbi:MAG: hypothetical protein Q8K66_13090 [Sediminibacterium sp.]|nr:hypothetical protein [Sediminibacterium sp.]MDP3128830.1 hypothetical protein [Sediminibacterium sp.]